MPPTWASARAHDVGRGRVRNREAVAHGGPAQPRRGDGEAEGFTEPLGLGPALLGGALFRSLPEEIKFLRKSPGWSGVDVARRLGVSGHASQPAPPPPAKEPREGRLGDMRGRVSSRARYLSAARAFLASSWPGKGVGEAAAAERAWQAASVSLTWAETLLRRGPSPPCGSLHLSPPRRGFVQEGHSDVAARADTALVELPPRGPRDQEPMAQKDFGSFKVCGEGKYPKTVLLRAQTAKGQKL